MKVFKFEVADWNAPDAQTKAQTLFEAQADAMGMTITEADTATFNAMAGAIGGMLTALGADSQTGATVYISATAQVVDDNSQLTLNFGFRIDYPQA